jgi:hypothetical protein
LDLAGLLQETVVGRCRRDEGANARIEPKNKNPRGGCRRAQYVLSHFANYRLPAGQSSKKYISPVRLSL